mgnify:CR=1 FL=1
MTVDQAVPAVLATAAEARSWQEPLYRDLHQNPELSHAEHRTAGIVADRLRQSGYEVTTGIGGTGVVGILRNGTGPTVLLRPISSISTTAANRIVAMVMPETGLFELPTRPAM